MRVKTNHIESQADKLWIITGWFFLSYIQYWYLFKLYCYIVKTYTFDIIKKSSSFSVNAKQTFVDEINLNTEYLFISNKIYFRLALQSFSQEAIHINWFLNDQTLLWFELNSQH